jgi:hypothetical protein
LSFEHVTPQLPQFSAVPRGVSQPFSGTPSQLFQPSSHVGWHPFVALQAVSPCEFVQASAQERQCTSVPSSVSHPGADVQSANPLLQSPKTHSPRSHTPVALSKVQRSPQAPQFCAELLRSVSHPFSARPSQFAKPASHSGRQRAPLHEVAPCAFSQATSHAPQCSTSSTKLVSQPVDTCSSQSP